MTRTRLDLTGEVCPYTFVRAKLALEELVAGDELELIVDHRPAWLSLPRSLREEGHELVGVEPFSGENPTLEKRLLTVRKVTE